MRVFCNGFNSYGQLNTNRTVLANFEPLFQFEVIRKVCINYFFSVIVTSNGCWICNKNELKLVPMEHVEKIRQITSNDEKIILLSETGKLTKSDLDNLFDFKEIPLEISPVSGYDDHEEKIINVSSCSKLTVAYSNKSTLFEIPNKLHYGDPFGTIIDVKCGREHCLLLDQSGAVYSFGRGSRGQLGHGILDDEQAPVLVKALAGIKITQISAGGWHSSALSQDGDLYIWGWNGNGQLGLSTDGSEERISVMTNPTVVDVEDSDRNVSMVASGCRHTIALLDNNQLYGCGWNKYKQLKDVEEENIYKFTHLHDFKEEEVVDVICGPWNSAVICD